MHIVGGNYREKCYFPLWDRIFGSGGRAALAVSGISPGSVLHSYAYAGWANDVRLTMRSVGIEAHIREINEELVFGYWHALRKDAPPEILQTQPPLEINAPDQAALVFGMLEGQSRVSASRLVFEPQSARPVDSFVQSQSSAQELAYVVKTEELPQFFESRMESRDAARRIMDEQGARLVITRGAVGGATVYAGDRPPISVPKYESPNWFRIGAGDVFCAAFAYHWAERREDPVTAADLASRSAAFFNDGHRIPLPHHAELQTISPVPEFDGIRRVYLAGPYVTMPQFQLLDDAHFYLSELGVEVVSPFHKHYRPDLSAASVAELGIADLSGCHAVLAFADNGEVESNISVGLARAQGIPVIVLAEALSTEAKTMMVGTGCELTKDLPTAIYRTWVASAKRKKEAL